MKEYSKYLVLFLLIFICYRETVKFKSFIKKEKKRCYYCYNTGMPFTGEILSLGDTIDYGNFLEGRELESYLLDADTECYSYVGNKKTLPFSRRPLFSYTKTINLEWVSIGDKTYLRKGREWTRLRAKETHANTILQRDQAEYLKNLSCSRGVGDPVNEREKKKINRSLLEMEQRIERLKENT